MLYSPNLAHIVLPNWFPFFPNYKIPFLHFIFNLADTYQTIADIIILSQYKELFRIFLKINNYWKPLHFKTKKYHIYIQQAIIAISIGLLYYLIISNKKTVNCANSHLCYYVSKIITMINMVNFVIILKGIIFIKFKKIKLHKNFMGTALFLSLVFIILFIWHVNLVGLTIYGDINGNKILESWEYTKVSKTIFLYYIILSSHIIIAIIILPLVLITAFKALVGDVETHKKLSMLIYPFWLYVTITSPIINYMISPYLS